MSADREKQWERVQIKGFTAWINSYLNPRGLPVEDLQKDLCTGVRLCTFVELVRDRSPDENTRKAKLDRWEKNPTIRLHYINNVSCALKFITQVLKVKLVAIGPEDIVDGNVKLILGLLWSVFRRLRNEQLNVGDSAKDEEQALLAWVREQTKGYKGVEIKGWKDSWHDGLALSALINKFDPDLLNYDALNPANREANLKGAFATAEQKMGIPQLLEAEDLMNNNPDERSVIFYISLFFHAFVSNEEKRRLAADRAQSQSQVVDLQTRLQQEIAAREEEERRRKQLEAELERLRKELEDLKTRLRMNELLHIDDKSSLEEKIKALMQLLETEGADKASIEEQMRRYKKQLEEAERAREELEELRKKLQAEGSSLYDELQRAEEEKKRLRAELEDLKKKIKAEMERRKSKAKAALELERENAALKRQAILQGKARSGLEVLKRNLEEHLEDMYQWRQLHQLDVEQQAPEVFDLQKVLEELAKKSFEDQLDVLNNKLQGENINLQRIIRLKDKDAELKDAIDKQGWLEIKGVGKAAKEWKKQWFVLRGSNLTYYKSDKEERPSGTIPMAEVEFVDAKGEDDRKYLIGIKVASAADKLIVLSGSSRKERDEWRALLNGAIVHLRYLESVEKKGPHRPDTRLVNLFKSTTVNNVFLDGKEVRAEEIAALSSTLAANPDVDTISISNASLGDSEVSSLAKQLGKATFRVLKLSNNKITSKGAVALAKALGEGKGLVEIHLDGNDIGDEGLEAFAGLLGGKESKLTTVNFSGNKIGDKGLAGFAKALASSQAPVKTLLFSGNSIGDGGASAIAEALKSKHTPTHVNLAKNKIGDAGAAALSKALEHNDSVTELDLSENNISNAGALALRDALKHGKSIHQVHLSGNKNIKGGSDLSGIMGENFGFPSLTITRRE